MSGTFADPNGTIFPEEGEGAMSINPGLLVRSDTKYSTVLFRLFVIVTLVEAVKVGVVARGWSNTTLTFVGVLTLRLSAVVVFTNSKQSAKTATKIAIVFLSFRISPALYYITINSKYLLTAPRDKITFFYTLPPETASSTYFSLALIFMYLNNKLFAQPRVI